jgi:hypothetical protein
MQHMLSLQYMHDMQYMNCLLIQGQMSERTNVNAWVDNLTVLPIPLTS